MRWLFQSIIRCFQFRITRDKKETWLAISRAGQFQGSFRSGGGPGPWLGKCEASQHVCTLQSFTTLVSYMNVRRESNLCRMTRIQLHMGPVEKKKAVPIERLGFQGLDFSKASRKFSRSWKGVYYMVDHHVRVLLGWTEEPVNDVWINQKETGTNPQWFAPIWISLYRLCFDFLFVKRCANMGYGDFMIYYSNFYKAVQGISLDASKYAHTGFQK